MQFNIKPPAANVLKKPSELKENQPIAVNAVHEALNDNGIACFCPDCGAEHSFAYDWPIGIPITCGRPGDDGTEICQCRFIIPNNVTIEV